MLYVSSPFHLDNQCRGGITSKWITILASPQHFFHLESGNSVYFFNHRLNEVQKTRHIDEMLLSPMMTDEKNELNYRNV